MGSPEDEEGCSSDGGPQHRATIGYRFAIGRYPVTFDEYDHHLCAATNRKNSKDEGWGRGRPVVNRPVIPLAKRGPTSALPLKT
jgi:formylglycine-generating enzyme required for sulfatase activity